MKTATCLLFFGVCAGVFGAKFSRGDELDKLPQAPQVAPTATPLPISPDAPPVTIATEVPPYVERGVAMVPMRPVCDFLGVAIEYNDGIVTLSKNSGPNNSTSRTVTFRAGGDTAQISDVLGKRAEKLPLPAEERLGNVFIPLRFIAELFGAQAEMMPEGNVILIKTPEKSGALTPTAQEGYRGSDAARLSIVNNVGHALSLHLSGPQKIAVELGPGESLERAVRPGVYYYQAAATGMKVLNGVRRLEPGRKATWQWGHR